MTARRPNPTEAAVLDALEHYKARPGATASSRSAAARRWISAKAVALLATHDGRLLPTTP